LGDRAAFLEWEKNNGGITVIPGGSNYSILSEFKGSILRLWNEFFAGKTNLQLSGDQIEVVRRRLFHLEHEIDGLLRRKIQFSVKDVNGG
jgi:hypothetical protein